MRWRRGLCGVKHVYIRPVHLFQCSWPTVRISFTPSSMALVNLLNCSHFWSLRTRSTCTEYCIKQIILLWCATTCTIHTRNWFAICNLTQLTLLPDLGLRLQALLWRRSSLPLSRLSLLFSSPSSSPAQNQPLFNFRIKKKRPRQISWS